jgi:hypothetical protein
MRQTAVEWLINELIPKDQHEGIMDIIEEAKEIEKQHIMDATYYGHLKGWVDDGVENSYGEQYYKETFKQQQDGSNTNE